MKSPFKDYPYLLEVPSFRGDYVDVWIREPFNPSRTNTFKCRKCGKNILWGKLNNGKCIPISFQNDGGVWYPIFHSVDCPYANQKRREKPKPLFPTIDKDV